MTKDTGEVAEVAEQLRLDVDGGDGSTAGAEGDDTQELDAIYDEPGEVVPEEDLR